LAVIARYQTYFSYSYPPYFKLQGAYSSHLIIDVSGALFHCNAPASWGVLGRYFGVVKDADNH